MTSLKISIYNIVYVTQIMRICILRSGKPSGVRSGWGETAALQIIREVGE